MSTGRILKRSGSWLLESPGFLLFLCILYPKLWIFHKNTFIFLISDLLREAAWTAVLCAPLLLLDLFVHFLKPRGWPRRSLDFLVVMLGGTIVLALKFPEIPPYTFLFPGAFLLSLPALRWRKFLYVILIIGLCTREIWCFSGRIFPTEYMPDPSLVPKPVSLPITFKHKPNIYLFLLESYTSNKALREIYHLPQNGLMTFLAEQNFSILEDCYANYDHTHGTAGALFFMNHHYHNYKYRELPIELHGAIFGRSPVYSTLKAQGYRICAINCLGVDTFRKWNRDVMETSYLDFRYLASYGLCRFYKIAKDFGFSETFSVFVNAVDWWADLIGGKTRSFSISAEDFLQDYLEERKAPPHFFLIYAGTDHSFGAGMNTDRGRESLDSFEKKEYPSFLQSANAELMPLLKVIHRHDPGALIVLMGDHGPRRYRGVEKGQGDVNALIRSYGIEPSLAALDAVGIFCAIKWPVPSYSEGQIISPVNLFRHIFAALTEDPSLLNHCVPNDSYASDAVSKLFKVVENGQPLKEWKFFSEH
ncbi:MAG: hypothetical protein LBF76_01030 [Holosporales bacterium]|jgi:hypothetical protein|nr:hypothetical protein [Holosporales bacterium]